MFFNKIMIDLYIIQIIIQVWQPISIILFIINNICVYIIFIVPDIIKMN